MDKKQTARTVQQQIMDHNCSFYCKPVLAASQRNAERPRFGRKLSRSSSTQKMMRMCDYAALHNGNGFTLLKVNTFAKSSTTRMNCSRDQLVIYSLLILAYQCDTYFIVHHHCQTITG